MRIPKDRAIEKELIIALRRGDKSAFKRIYHYFESSLYKFVYSYTKSKYVSEEIIQEVFIKLWEKRQTLDPSKSFDSFIYTMTRNLTFNYLRDASRRKSRSRELWNNMVSQRNVIEDELILKEYGDIIEDIIRELPQQKRSIYQLSRKEGKSNSEIADILGISSKTVKNHLWKTMGIIRSQLKPYIEDTTPLLIILFTFL
ncbi:RNA polymerase sigma factor [Membranihabitans maritimus]|uniref:RNA polymerase sigma factor n=1 Tax=Membranihabitans maritimus TaxID=2904244 RepID=UPI001F171F63|nr:RNA polymerase sigma-70 factor [Membranihabitans maritimus]